MRFYIEEELAQAVLNYIGAQGTGNVPAQQVMGLCEGLSRLEPVEEPEPETPEGEEKPEQPPEE